MTTRTKVQSITATASNHGFSLFSDEKLLQLYTAMVESRCVNERLKILGQLDGDEEAVVGQEAAMVGIVMDVLPEDTVALSQSDALVKLIHGVSFGKKFGHFYGCVANPNLDDQLNIATRAARENSEKKNDKIAIVFSRGDSCFSEEVLSQAVLQKLPLLFVSLNSPASKQAPVHLREFGIPSIPVDGNDVVAVYRVATEAITHARKGNGPTLIECILDGSKAHDPILKMEAYLKRKSIYRAEMKLEVTASLTQELDAIIKAGIRARNT